MNSRSAEVRARSGPLRPGAGPTPRCRPARAAAALRPRAGTLAGAAASAPARRVGAAGAAGGSVQSPGGCSASPAASLRVCLCTCIPMCTYTNVYAYLWRRAETGCAGSPAAIRSAQRCQNIPAPIVRPDAAAVLGTRTHGLHTCILYARHLLTRRTMCK